MIRLENVCLGYGKKEIIKDLSLDLNKGEILSLLGPNGSGKSTTIKGIAGLLKRTSGTIEIEGKDIDSINNRELSHYLSYVPQQMGQIPCTTVLDVVLIGRNPFIKWQTDENDLRMAEKAMEIMGILDMSEMDVNELSGGQKQRVHIARSICQDPEYYLFDEPTSALDLRYQLELMTIMKNIISTGKSGMVIALHDLNLAIRFSDKVAIIRQGELYDYGRPGDVITEKAILDVYGMRSKITEVEGCPCVVAIGPDK